HEFSLLPMPQNKNSLEISIEYEDKDEMTVAHMVDGVDANSGLKLFSLKDMKFTYVVSCQLYGAQKKSSADYTHSCYANILDLMLTYPSLRVAYIDERERERLPSKADLRRFPMF
ncbi:callose synthase 7-like protein, partial [Tanacetum coccineum]